MLVLHKKTILHTAGKQIAIHLGCVNMLLHEYGSSLLFGEFYCLFSLHTLAHPPVSIIMV